MGSKDKGNLYKGSKMGFNMKENGSETYEMASVNKNGLMEQSMMDNGGTIKQKERASLSIPMAIITKENGRMIKPMDMERLFM
jgi:hypothetical protein